MATRKRVSNRPVLVVNGKKISESKVRDVILEEIALERKAQDLREAILRERLEELIGDAGYAARRRDNWYRLVE